MAEPLRPDVHFEVQVRRRGRWLIETACAGREEALLLARRLAARPHGPAVRVMRETYHPDRDLAFAHVIFDTTLLRSEARTPRRRTPLAPRAAPAPGMPAASGARLHAALTGLVPLPRSIGIGGWPAVPVADGLAWLTATGSGLGLAAAMIALLFVMS